NHSFSRIDPTPRRSPAGDRLVEMLFENRAQGQRKAQETQHPARRPDADAYQPLAQREADNSGRDDQRAQNALTLIRHEDDGRAIGDDFAHALAHFGGIEAHHDDGVRAHGGGVAHQPVHSLAPGLLEQLRVFVDFTAGDRTQAGHDIAADAAASHDDAESLADRLLYPISRN